MELRERLQEVLGSAYTIQGEIEGGGMSRVFLARDTALRRDIVVKLLRPELLSGVSLDRFKREIDLEATLQHPHIVPLLSAGTVDGVPYYTMPFVRGESLRARLGKSGKFAVGETVHVLRDVAAALAHAHAEGVVHRDIKPENVLLSGGVAVVTDFGVAKAVDVAAAGSGQSRDHLTSIGVALGTPAYMSPEQAVADPSVDHRADFYSFGCVAYEMLSGSGPFGTRSPQAMLSAHVLEQPESLATRQPGIPPGLTALVMKCLEKRPEHRPQSATELLDALDALSTPSGGTHPTDARPTLWRHRPAWIVAAVLAALAVGLFVWKGRGSRGAITVESTRIVSALTELELDPAISPDGRLVTYAKGSLGKMRIFVRQLDGRDEVPLSRALDGEHRWPQWSPDGSRILFVVKSDLSALRGVAYVVPYVGGTPQRTMEVAGDRVMTPTWAPDGNSIAYSDGTEILIHRVDGGPPRSVGSEVAAHSPAFSPDGRTLAYVRGNPQSRTVLNIAASSIWTVPVTGGNPARVTDTLRSNTSPVWTPDGSSLLFISDAAGERDIYVQRLSSGGTARGNPARLTTGLGAFSVSLSGAGDRAVAAIVRVRSHVWRAPIAATGVTPASALQRITNEAEAIEGLDVSRDGKWLTYDSNRSGNQDVYKVSIDGGQPIQLTHDPAPDFVPQWSPNGREIAYYSMRSGNRDVRVMSADGRDDHAVTADSTEDFYPTWSPDGAKLAFLTGWGRKTRVVEAVRDRGGNRWSPKRPISDEASNEGGGSGTPRWSPDGKWIAYPSLDYKSVRLVSPVGGLVRTLITDRQLRGGLRFAAWGSDAGIVYVLSFADSNATNFWAVPLNTGAPRLVLALGRDRSVRRHEFSTDGRHLYFTLGADESDIWLINLRR